MQQFLFENVLVILILPVAYYTLWRLFRKTWKTLDEEAHAWNTARLAKGLPDFRPWAVFAIAAVILAWQEYYGSGRFYRAHIAPWLCDLDQKFPTWIQYNKYQVLYGYIWWELSLVLGYVFFPFMCWKILFPKDALLDFGLRTRGFLQHSRIYGLFLLLLILAVVFASFRSSFVGYYPCYRLASRSWYDLLLWEAIYLPGFFALELFFRGWWLVALRKSLGSAAIFSMTVPYCMIHFGKPYLETMGTVMGAIALGSLSMKTKSVYQGTLLHITLALSMDLLALWQRNAFPTAFWP
mmetsp:Transcript_10489/g.24297  ORF Transcript_10489/g.24297 Transcript_10489/m.24297 type:complete len:295 (+) Transcript_10489:212-1096(+)